MSYKGFLFMLLLSLLHTGTLYADTSAARWHLPQDLDDGNVTIEFELDTTWHTVHGKTSLIKGNASLADEKDPTTVKVEVQLPVSKFDTGGSMRDSELREVMASDYFPFVVFEVMRLMRGCTPAVVLERGQCADELDGMLRIRDKRSPTTIPVVIKRDGDGFAIVGKTDIRWADFGVEDPSMLIARVKPIVTVHFEVHLRKKAGS